MKTSKTGMFLTLIVTLLMGVSSSGSAFAVGGGHGGGGWRGGGGWHGGTRVGIYLGAPIGFNYGYYPYSYYGTPYYGSPYYPPASAYYPLVQSAPVTYTEQDDASQFQVQEIPKNLPQDAQGSWWYYCADSKAYYPYVNQCPGGWLKVVPQPAPGSDTASFK
ncbi:MAG: hypothetical protein DID92_2727745193 [Candidatus Nitrotoga sp. SPKER]|nr:MAG: hypothetical protein DID92_2727745193 [Candidatus Nitrotoga sp. SPKER]